MCAVISNLRRVMRTSPKDATWPEDRPAATKRESETGNSRRQGIKLEVLAGQAAGRQLKLDEVREIPLIHR